MSWQIFVLECIAVCILFGVYVVGSTVRNPLQWFQDYPKEVQDKYCLLHPDYERSEEGKGRTVVKVIFLIVCILLLGILIRASGADSFLHGTAGAYILWVVVNWFDVFVLDLGILSHWKRIRLEGTEEMDKEYKGNSRYHIKGGGIGMVIGIPAALLCGGMVCLIGLVI